jgi:hypothetical protein
MVQETRSRASRIESSGNTTVSIGVERTVRLTRLLSAPILPPILRGMIAEQVGADCNEQLVVESELGLGPVIRPCRSIAKSTCAHMPTERTEPERCATGADVRAQSHRHALPRAANARSRTLPVSVVDAAAARAVDAVPSSRRTPDDGQFAPFYGRLSKTGTSSLARH